MINKIKDNIKLLCIIAVVMLLFSCYFALILQSLLSGLGIDCNPITLIGKIPEMGFPIQGTFVMFLAFSGFIAFTYYKSKSENTVDDERNFKYSGSGVYGTAALLKESELQGYAKVNSPQKAMGTILGQLDKSGNRIVNTDMESRMNRHIAVFGASGSGKSRCFARPFLIQAVKRRESVIVTDPKGELYESTAQYMKENGYTVKILDLVHPIKSDGWDCLKELRGDEIRAQIFANVIIQNTGSGKGDVWDVSAMALLKALLLRVERGKDYKQAGNQNIGEAYQLIQNPRGEEYLDEMFDTASLTRDEQLCIGPYMTFKQASPNMRGNIITGLAARMQVFQNEVIRRITAVDDIDLTLPATEPCAYYCIMSDQHTTLNFISTLFFTYLFMDLVEYADTHGGHCPVPVNFVLDEFPNIGSIPDFEKKIATVRSRRINISIIFQGITQLQERYPLGKWQGILGNCDTHLFLGCNESDTAEFISERAGEATVKVKTEQHEKIESLFTFGYRHSTGDGKRKIFTTDEIMRFPLDKELIIFRGKNALQADKYDFSLHPESLKFRDIRIMDRPDIDDKEGRASYRHQDDEYMEAYLRRMENNPKCDDYINDDEDEDQSFRDKFVHGFMQGKKGAENADKENTSSENSDEAGIELRNSDYKEYESDVIPEDDISIVEDTDFVIDSIYNPDNEFDNIKPDTNSNVGYNTGSVEIENIDNKDITTNEEDEHFNKPAEPHESSESQNKKKNEQDNTSKRSKEKVQNKSDISSKKKFNAADLPSDNDIERNFSPPPTKRGKSFRSTNSRQG